MDSDQWRNFASSSYQQPRHHQHNAGGTSFPLRDALTTASNNNSSGVGPKASFFVTNKSSALSSPSAKDDRHEVSLSAGGYSPPKKIQSIADVSPQPKQQQRQPQQKQRAPSVDELRDIALKHLFNADMMAADTAAAFSSPISCDNKNKTATSPSSGLTPLKTAPLRLGLRRRLGMTIMSQGSNNAHHHHEEEEQDEDDQHQQHSMMRELEAESRTAAAVLKSIGARALLQKDVPLPQPQLGSDMLRQQREANRRLKKQQQELEESQHQDHLQQKKQQHDFQQPSYTVQPAAAGAGAASPTNDDDQQQQKNPVSVAAMARIRHMLHEEADTKQQHKPQQRHTDSSADLSGEFHIVGQKQQQSSSSYHQVEKNKSKNNANAVKPVDRTGDFRAPLARARDALQRCMSDFGMDLSSTAADDLGRHKSRKAPSASATCRFLENKFETLHGVAMQIEVEENRMRTATAAVLAELVALKKLEQAAKAEAMTWMDYDSATDEGEDFLEAKGAARAAEEFLMALE